MSGDDSVGCDRHETNILADALGAALCAHDLVVRELVVLAIHARLFDKRAGVCHETGHSASDVAEGEGVRNERKRTQWCLE
jgi:hypothetical protein